MLLGHLSHADPEADIRTATAQAQGHPRLYMNAEQAARLPERAALDAQNAKLARCIIATADDLIDTPPLARVMTGKRLLFVSRAALNRIMALAMAWHLTEDSRYVERASMEVRAVAAFEDWNPAHFLDTAEMTHAVAIAYDWLNSAMDAETREIALQAIWEKGLTPTLADKELWWFRATNNWNQVCHGGMVAGALVLLEREPEAANHILERAVRHVPRAMAHYAPAGAYPEGPAYWSYGTSYNVAMLAMLESALGSTFGLCDMEGFSETGAFPMMMTGPSGQFFNFSDGRPDRRIQHAVYWLSKRFTRPDWTANEDTLLEHDDQVNWLSVLGLLWREPNRQSAEKYQPPLHWTSRNTVPVSVHRESWDQNGTFIGVKAGPPTASHGQMDAGSFVLDAGGIRWSHDLGQENYHLAETHGLILRDKRQDGDRWKVFRYSNHAHNTLVIDGQLQHAAGNATIIGFSDHPAFPHTVVDMSSAYAGQATHAHRGIALLPSGSVLLRDHLSGLRPGAEVRWGMVTRAKADKAGQPDIILSETNKTLVLSIHGLDGPKWEVIDISDALNPWDSPNHGTSMVAFTAIAPQSGELDITVVIRPGDREATVLEATHLAPPQDWLTP